MALFLSAVALVVSPAGSALQSSAVRFVRLKSRCDRRLQKAVVGFGPSEAPFLLHAATKGLLLRSTLAASGVVTERITVSREHALADCILALVPYAAAAAAAAASWSTAGTPHAEPAGVNGFEVQDGGAVAAETMAVATMVVETVAVDVRPFFKSVYGTKSMGGDVHVEAGEGHGPRKEFFSLVGQQLCSPIPDTFAPPEPCNVVGDGGDGPRLDTSVASGIFAFAAAFDSDDSLSAYSEDFEDDSDSSANDEAETHSSLVTLFGYHHGLEALWFREAKGVGGALAGRSHTNYMAVGVLFAAAIAGGCTLGVPIPRLLLDLLVRHRQLRPGHSPWAEHGTDVQGCDAALHALDEFDPVMAASARRVLALPDDDFATMLDLDFDDQEALSGQESAIQLADASESERRAWYVRWMATQTIIEPHRAELLALAAGFSSGLPLCWVQTMLSAAELAELLCGQEHGGDTASRLDFKFGNVFRVEMDAELLEATNAPLRRALWTVVDQQLNADERRALLDFVTGIDRVPAAGIERLTISMPWTVMAGSLAEQQLQLQMLPQAHTCTNTLELPNYWQALLAVAAADGTSDQQPPLERRLEHVLLERLRLAIAGAGGYGLDE